MYAIGDPFGNLQLNDRDSKKRGSGGTRNGGSSGRLSNHRVSLLGKPLNYRPTRRDVKYRKLQAKLYNFLERPTGKKAAIYHALVFLMVFLCLSLSVVSTIENHEYEDLIEDLLFQLEIVIVIWFGIEFLIRLWSSGCRSRYQGCIGRLRFMKSPFCIIDVITVVASIVMLIGPGGQMFAASALRGLRFFQILRMVRMDRRGGTWKLLGSVVYAHRQELITTIYIGFLGLVFSSFVIYLVEKDDNEQFRSFADALWWGVITLCTVGYGDAVPKSWKGKLIASGCALLGISFFALPAGILGSGFALKVQQQQRQKHMIRRRVPAATLIQCLWRCYAADENSCSDATWKIHMIPQRSPPPRKRGSTEDSEYRSNSRKLSANRLFRGSFKNNASFVTRFNTLRRGRSTIHSPAGHSMSNKLQPSDMASNENLNSTPGGGGGGGGEMTRDGSETRLTKKGSDDEEEHLQPITLTRQHKGAIRAIRKLKYLVARKKFKEALKPYDVKDVIESYSAGHADLVTKVKGLQTRLDQILGRQGSKAKDVYDSKQSLASRVVKTERQVDDIEDKLDRFIQMYEEDRKRFATLPFGSPLCPPCSPMPSSPSPPYNAFQAQLPINHPTLGTIVPSIKPKPILVDTSEAGSPSIGGVLTSQDSIASQQFPKRPMIKKRVTLSPSAPTVVSSSEKSGYVTKPRVTSFSLDAEAANDSSDSNQDSDSSIPAEYILQSPGQPSTSLACHSSSVTSMNLPSVRIEGCTPPSDSSFDGDLDQYGARCSIDSTNLLEFRPSDLDSSSLTEQEVDPVPTTTTTTTTTTPYYVTPSPYGMSATAVTSASGTTEIVVTPVSLHHHPHMHHHHRQYRQQHLHHHYAAAQQRVIPRVTVVEAGRATSTGDIDVWVDEQPQHSHPSVRRVTSSPVPKSFLKDIP